MADAKEIDEIAQHLCLRGQLLGCRGELLGILGICRSDIGIGSGEGNLYTAIVGVRGGWRSPAPNIRGPSLDHARLRADMQ